TCPSRRHPRSEARTARAPWPRLIAGGGEAGQGLRWRPSQGLPRIAPPMKTTFRPRLLNGQTGDPALLLTLRWQGRALLLDLGRIDRVPAALLLPIEAVFVCPAHIAPFLGLDPLLPPFPARHTTLRPPRPPGRPAPLSGPPARLR